jgi:hypothetical protein
MAQAVSRRPFNAEARVHDQESPSWICDEETETGRGFSPTSSVFPCQYHFAVAVNKHISGGAV